MPPPAATQEADHDLARLAAAVLLFAVLCAMLVLSSVRAYCRRLAQGVTVDRETQMRRRHHFTRRAAPASERTTN
jgi:hypothetical protein